MSSNERCRRWSSNFRTAFWRGAHARAQGVTLNACPYDQSATAVIGRGRHIPTWARGYANAWRDGWDSAGPVSLEAHSKPAS